MELTVRDIANAWQSAQVLLNRKLKTLPSFWLSRQIRKIQMTYISYEESRADMVRQYGAIDPNGNEWRVKPENEARFAAEHKALLDETVDEDIEPKPVDYLRQDDIEGSLLLNLWFLFTDEDPPEPAAEEEKKGGKK